MLKVFRKIRQSLINTGSTRKYLMYALGEITLVVIGILIALQINNWNQYRLERIEEEKILVAVSKDLDHIKYWCEICSASIKEVIVSCNRLLDNLHSTKIRASTLQSEVDLAKIFKRCLIGEGLSENIYDVLKSSDQLELVTSRELRNELASLDSQLGTMKSFERLQNEFMDTQLKPFINQYIDRTRLTYDMVGYKIEIDTTAFEKRFNQDYDILYNQRAFSNLIIDFIMHNSEIIDLYKLISESTTVIDSLLLTEMKRVN